MKYLILLPLLLVLQGCTLLSLFTANTNKPVAKPCNQETTPETIRAAQKAGCKRYLIEKDAEQGTCKFICHESR
jgi:hypothetical protein